MLLTPARALSKIDYPALISAALLCFMGITVLYNAGGDNSLAIKQVLWLALAILTYFLLHFFDLSFLKNGKLLLYLFLLSLASLIAVLFLGDYSKGAQSRFYFSGFALQPSDPAKLVLILVLAKYFSKRHMEIANVKHVLVSGVYAALLIIPILLQPDLGVALTFAGIWFFMILLSGISKKHLFAMLISALLLAVFSWSFLLQDYQKARIVSFLDPMADIRGAGYNAYQATVAVGSGGLWGKGIGFGTQSKLQFLPEYETDFIFAAFAEEWGFFGVVIMLSLFAVLMYRIISVALKSDDNFVILSAVGVSALLFTHFVVNVGMNLGLLPITGIPLPFVSYGGSHLLAEFAALAILTSLGKT